tara:strand:+ start:1190 stop:1864 length:675 start_codon:yes stop_codon:yes gene_type:complete
MTETENVAVNGYHGGFLSELPTEQLKKCSENDIDMDFKLNSKASLNSDPAVVNMEIQQSFGPSNYHLDSMYGCDCGLEKAREVQLSQPYVNFKGGEGWMGENGCLIDKDSDVRFDVLTNKKYINQLPHLLNQGFFGKGEHDVDTESIIRDSLITKIDRPCNVLSGSTTLPYSITPMVERLESEVQDPIHIIPEDTMAEWPRGGLPSRQIARNIDYLNRKGILNN